MDVQRESFDGLIIGIFPPSSTRYKNTPSPPTERIAPAAIAILRGQWRLDGLADIVSYT